MILSLQFSGRKGGSVAKTPENTALSGARPRGKACATPNIGYRQERRGRPGPGTRYVKREDTRFDLTYRLAHDRLAEEARCDGIFPRITNVMTLTERDLLLAYEQPPRIERVESRPCQGLCSFLGLFPGRTLLSPHLRKHLGL